MRHLRTLTPAALLITLLSAACSDEPAGPEEPSELAGVSFGANGGHSAAGIDPGQGGDIFSNEFAVARADSLQGLVLISFEPEGEASGNIFVLQTPRAAGTYECGTVFTAAPCHGRYFTGAAIGETIDFDNYYEIESGSVTFSQVGPDRLKGTFSIVLREFEGGNAVITVEDGTIDVPYSATPLNAGSLRCLAHLAQGSITACGNF